MSAAQREFPNSEIKGCYFYLCQSIVTNVESLGLKNDYENNIEVKLKIKSLAALTFVPINEVREVFNNLAATLPNDERFTDILNYFFCTYIESATGREPKFPMNVWNHRDAAIEKTPKTKNTCEGFHNSLNALFHCSHPSIWTLLYGLEKDIACQKLILIRYKLDF